MPDADAQHDAALDVALTYHGGTRLGWRALRYPGGFLHVSEAGNACSPSPDEMSRAPLE
jgi:hypothetical protein